jgi:acetyltransferase
VRVCFNDYARELALVVEQGEEILGVGRMQRNPLRMEEAEVAFLVRDSAQGKGIGGALLGKLLTIAAREGLERLTAELLPENTPMRRLLERYGFRSRLASDGQTLFASYPVQPLPSAPAGA